ncbi:MAG: sugar phosphate isomerase/epimerase [Oscillospiraceae bacterium]
MKFGICTGVQEDQGVFLIPHIDFLQKSGFSYVELPLYAIATLSEEKFDGLREYLRTLTVPVLACNCFMDGKIHMTGKDYDSVRFQRYVKKAVSRAHKIGVEKLVLGSGGSRNIPAGFSKETAKKQFESCVRFAAEECALYGIELEIEHLNRLESNLLTSFEESVDFVEKLALPNCKVVLDYFHFALGNENPRLILRRVAAIGHIHFARPLGRVFPEPEDLPDLRGILNILRQSGYTGGTFSMECAFPDMEKEPNFYGNILAAFARQLP